MLFEGDIPFLPAEISTLQSIEATESQADYPQQLEKWKSLKRIVDLFSIKLGGDTEV